MKESNRKTSSSTASFATETSKACNRRELLRAAAAGFFVTGTLSQTGQASIGDALERRQSWLTDIKMRAINDYRISTERFGGALSNPIDRLLYAPKNQDGYQFDVAVIGSGYGASIAAAGWQVDYAMEKDFA